MDARRCGRLRHARGNGRPPLRAFKTCEGERNLPAAMWKKGDALPGATRRIALRAFCCGAAYRVAIAAKASRMERERHRRAVGAERRIA